MPFFFMLFLLWLLSEIAVFGLVADEVGAVMALFMLFLSAVIGGIIIKNQGFATLLSMHAVSRHGRLPMDALFDTLCIVTAGILFIVPGFLSDIAALLLILAPGRRILRTIIRNNTNWAEAQTRSGSDILEGEFEHVEEDLPKIRQDNT